MFRNRKYYAVDFAEFTRRLKRQFDGNLNYRKLLLILFISAVIFLYIGPYVFSWLFGSSTQTIRKSIFVSRSKTCQNLNQWQFVYFSMIDTLRECSTPDNKHDDFLLHISDLISRCMDDRLTPFYTKAFEFNAQIQHINDLTGQTGIPVNQRSIPYVGNGFFGIEISKGGEFYVKYGRHLSQPIHYQPIVDFKYIDDRSESEEPHGKQAIVVDYVNGVVHKFQCFGNDVFVSNEFYGNEC